MFSRELTNEIETRLSIPQFAEELYALTERNRTYLSQWLPWLEKTRSAEDTEKFLLAQLQKYAKGEALHVTIFHEGSLAGAAGFNTIDQANETATIGYWLGVEYTRKGIITTVVRDLVHVGQKYYSLRRFEIRCATGNQRSRAVAERLGFKLEGTLHRAEKVGRMWYDHAVYALVVG